MGSDPRIAHAEFRPERGVVRGMADGFSPPVSALMYQVSRPLDHLRGYAWHSLSSEKHASSPDPSQVKRLLERTDEVGELGRVIRWASGPGS